MNAAESRALSRSIERKFIALGWVSSAFGAAVVFMAIGFLIAVFSSAEQRDQLGEENLPLLFGSVIVIGLVIGIVAKKRRDRTFGWLREGREPSDEERQLTLGFPAFASMVTGAGWITASFLGAGLNLDHGFGTAAIIAVSVWLGGETCSALTYLLFEKTLRPVTAIVLADRQPASSRGPGVRDRLLVAWSLGTGAPVLAVLVVGIAGLARPEADPEAVAAACIFLGSVALAVGFFATMLTAKALADPLRSMRKAVARVEAGDLDVKVPINDASEVGMLQAGINRMTDGLRERERIRDLFGRQVGEEVARAALRDGTTRLGGEEREIGALFVDLTGSTSMSLAMPPSEVVRLLNKFFRVVIDVVESEGGFVNKFEGDAALCVFGAPVASDDPAGKALCAARRLGERLEREVPEVGFGVGVSAGKAVAGNVGSEQRFEYTVIGDPVNEAARLSDLAKERQMGVVASGAALDRAKGDEPEMWEAGERTVLRGRLEATVLATPAGTERSPSAIG